jgi:hypothetical protein
VHERAWKSDDATLYRKVKAQTFFWAGGLQRYFLVHAANGSSNSTPSVSVMADTVKSRLAEWAVTKQAHEEKAQIMDRQVAKTDKTGWFKRTGWLEHLAGRNLAHLAHQTRLPDRDEVKLQPAARLVELLVERSVAGLSTLPRETRRWLRSAKRQEVDPHPLARLQNPESQARYASYIVKFVCYFLRILADVEASWKQSSCGGSGNNNNDSDRDSNIDSNSDSDSNSSSGDDRASNCSSRRPSCARKEADRMKDVRELFFWKDEGQGELVVALWYKLDGNDKDEAQYEA